MKTALNLRKGFEVHRGRHHQRRNGRVRKMRSLRNHERDAEKQYMGIKEGIHVVTEDAPGKSHCFAKSTVL